MGSGRSIWGREGPLPRPFSLGRPQGDNRPIPGAPVLHQTGLVDASAASLWQLTCEVEAPAMVRSLPYPITPLVLGVSPARRSSGASAARIALASALKTASTLW